MKRKNLRPTPYGWQLYTRIKGQFVSEHVSQTDPPSAMDVRNWKRAQHTAHTAPHLIATQPADETTLAEDVAEYLKARHTMLTLTWRAADLALWVERFGHRSRASLTALEIRQQLEAWRKQGYAANTVNHRRTALMNLYTVLDGKTAPNPVKDVPRYRELPHLPRALAPAVVAALLDAMPESVTKARLRLMAWTGWPHAQIRNLTPADIDWRRAVYLRPRQKGHGVEGRWLPLLPAGWLALRAFKRAGAWGAFSTSSMRTSLRLAASKVQANKRLPKAIREAVADVTPYDLRHSFLTLVAVATGDDRVVAELGMHADVRTSRRYTAASVDPRVTSGLRKIASLVASDRPKQKSGGKSTK